MEFVKSITSDHELIALAERIGVNLDGILAIDELTPELADDIRKNTWMILLRSGNEGVGHWVCTNDGEYFDPTGVGPPESIGDMPYNEFQFQGSYSEFCGVYCLLWLYAKQKNKPNLMKGFTNLDIDVL